VRPSVRISMTRSLPRPTDRANGAVKQFGHTSPPCRLPGGPPLVPSGPDLRGQGRPDAVRRQLGAQPSTGRAAPTWPPPAPSYNSALQLEASRSCEAPGHRGELHVEGRADPFQPVAPAGVLGPELRDDDGGPARCGVHA